jgi:hypothetical protein
VMLNTRNPKNILHFFIFFYFFFRNLLVVDFCQMSLV